MPPVYDQEQMDISNQVCMNIINMSHMASLLCSLLGNVTATRSCLVYTHYQVVTASWKLGYQYRYHRNSMA